MLAQSTKAYIRCVVIMKIPATLCGHILTLEHSRKTLYAIVNNYNSHLISALFSFPFVNKP